MIAFPIMAAVFASSSFSDEWTRKTMEVLCATPLSSARIVYGKLVSAFGKVFLIGLTLLPIQAVYLQLGRIPPRLVLVSLGVIVAGTILFGTLAIFEASGVVRRKRPRGARMDALLLYLFVTFVPALFLWQRYPAIVAAIPYWAFWFCLNGTSPGPGVSPNAFALLSIAVPLAVALVAIVLAPPVFRWAFARSLGGGRSRRRRFSRAGGRPRSPRPPLGEKEHPLFWQERGRPTRDLRWGLLVIDGGVLAIVAVLAWFVRDIHFEILIRPEMYTALSFVGAAVIVVTSFFAATRVFAREKVSQTATPLILTGLAPKAFFIQKLKALVYAQRFSFGILAVSLALAMFLPTGDNNMPVVMAVGIGVTAVLGVVLGTIPALVFSAAARSPRGALGGVFLSIPFAWACSAATAPIMLLFREGALVVTGIAAVIVIVILWIKVKEWQIWQLAFMLALLGTACNSLVGSAMLILVRSLGGDLDARTTWIMSIGGGLVLAVLYASFWYRLGVKIFDRVMLRNGQGAR